MAVLPERPKVTTVMNWSLLLDGFASTARLYDIYAVVAAYALNKITADCWEHQQNRTLHAR